MSLELILQVMLLVAAACVLVSVGLVIATYYFLCQAKRELRRISRSPLVPRDGDGRALRERR